MDTIKSIIHEEEEIKARIAKETDVLLQLRQLLKYAGWGIIRLHIPALRLKGYPDLMIMKNGRVIFIEVKRFNGKLSKQQRRFRDTMREYGVEYITAYGINDILHLCRDAVNFL